MKIGIPKETSSHETRVAVIPATVSQLKRDEHEVFVETGAGVSSNFLDDEFKQAGAEIISSAKDLYQVVDLIFKFQAPEKNEIDLLKEGSVLVCSLPPQRHSELIPLLQKKKITAFGMEYLPRITKAQSMDVLSSMATVAGYKAVLIAANHIAKFFPLLMTAAGTIPAAHVLILGAGVAGLQAIATAKRLGGRVEAFDPRPVVKEQIESLGGTFVEMEMPEDVETAGGYAKEQSDEFLKKEQEAIAARLPKIDAVICTAQIFGKQAPLLITDEMVKLMKPGSVIVDLAAAEGGNCELSKPNEMTEKYGVSVYGKVNLARELPAHASQMHSKNVTTLFKYIYQNGELDFEDEVTKNTCLTHNGEIINEMVKKNLS